MIANLPNHGAVSEYQAVPLDRQAVDLLRARRIALNLTRDDVAAAAGISPHFVRAIEQGYRAPSYRVLPRLAAALRLIACYHPVTLIPVESAKYAGLEYRVQPATPPAADLADLAE